MAQHHGRPLDAVRREGPCAGEHRQRGAERVRGAHADLMHAHVLVGGADRPELPGAVAVVGAADAAGVGAGPQGGAGRGVR